MLFTTSWDDGHPLDSKLAALLERSGVTGTFYLCPRGHRGTSLSKEEIQLLARRHEVGAHTLTHPSLPAITPAALREELAGSKKWLEQITGKECSLFAYPFGHCNQRVRDAVKAAGFRGARTTEDLLWRTDDPFLLSPSLQVHPFPFKPVWNRHAFSPLRTLWPQIRRSGIAITACRDWQHLARAAFLLALEQGKPWFHLWGHSWSLEQYQMWDDLTSFLSFVQSTKDVQHVRNSALLPAIYASYTRSNQ